MNLDFNNEKIDFGLKDLGKYHFEIIDQNIRNYIDFKNKVIVNAEFKKIFNSVMFQTMLLDPQYNNVNDLLDLYNGLARGGLFTNKVLKEITKKEFLTQLGYLGYTIKRTTRYVNKKVVNVSMIVKDKI